MHILMEGPQRGLVGDHFGQTDSFLVEVSQTAFGKPLVWVQCLPDRPNAIDVTVFLKGIKSAPRKTIVDLSQSGKSLPVMQPEDGIKCRNRNLGHMAPISAGPVVNVVVDELDVDISLDSGILVDSHRRKLRIAQRIGQKAIHHFGRGSVNFTVYGVFCRHELSYLFIPDHPVNPCPATGRGLGLFWTAASFDTIAILEGSLGK